MMRRHADLDPLEQALASLPLHEPTRKRSARIRARAHLSLEGPRWGERLVQSTDSVSWPRAVKSAAVTVAAAVYLAEVLRLAVYLSGL